MTFLSDIEKSRIGKGMKLGGIFSEVSGKIDTNDGTERVNQSLEIILGTSNGEVAMLPIVGSGLAQLIFEPADNILKDKLELYVRDAIEKLEPRIGIQDIIVDVVENHVFITVDYVLTGTNILGQFNYELTRQGRGDDY
jgi:hypothetical protein